MRNNTQPLELYSEQRCKEVGVKGHLKVKVIH